ncbi:cupin domain-containing protein [Ancylobacter terrae]|uniref:cupin domain-containing protein n=1 Tax=Ancylobacter sp. sgz301288 TaxID=3342077 RepID=UPI00385E4B69
MNLNIRRIVTGHDENGKSVVTIDEIASNVISRREKHASCVMWSTGEFPSDNLAGEDGSRRTVATCDPNGSVFRIVKYDPGVAPRVHRTESIDYAVVISGEIDMELDEGVIHLKQGDVLVQRGTMHNWVNRGTEACVIAFVLLASKPLVIASGMLKPTG